MKKNVSKTTKQKIILNFHWEPVFLSFLSKVLNLRSWIQAEEKLKSL